MDFLLDLFFGRSAAAVERPESLRVIGAGASRTGTKSLTEALRILGLRVYDLAGIVQNGHLDDTVRALRDPSTAGALFDRALDAGYTATLDTPTNMFWREQLARFPDGKVVLSVRDSTAAWTKSFVWASEAFAPLSHSLPWKWVANMDPLFDAMDGKLWKGLDARLNCTSAKRLVRPWWAPWVEYCDSRELDPSCCAAYYESLRKEVQAAVPAEKLLEFNVKQGWGPLCEFLGVPVPSQPFPHVNSAYELVIGYWFLRVVCWLWPLAALAPLGCLYCCCGRRHGQAKRKAE